MSERKDLAIELGQKIYSNTIESQQKKIDALENKLAEAVRLYECWQDHLPSMAHPLWREIRDWVESLEEQKEKR